MMKALWVGKTGLEAQDIALSTISNNMANASTTGFKKERQCNIEPRVVRNFSLPQLVLDQGE